MSPTWSTTYDHFVKVGDAWVLASAVQAIVPAPAKDVRIWLANGQCVDVDHPDGVDGVIRRFKEPRKERR